MQRRGFILGAALATAVVATTGAIAAIPDSNGVITSCRNNTDGTVRVIDTATTTTCPAGTTKLQWNQHGGVHWVRLNASGQVVAKSDGWGGNWGTGRYYAGWDGVDLTKCSISVAPVRDYSASPVMTSVYTTYSYYTMVETKGIKPSTWPIQYENVSTDVYITASCSYVPSPVATPPPG
jgi:hypothetical protein